MSAHGDMIKITDGVERTVHWLLAGSCLFCLISGLGLMFHSWSFIPHILGGYYAAKWMHIFSGVIFIPALVYSYFMWKKDCLFEPDDLNWILKAGGYLWEVKELPKVYKYNAGQKMFFVIVAISGFYMFITGMIMWFPLGFPKPLVRLMYLLHATGAVVMGAGIIVHGFLGTFANPGSVPAMMHGWVTKGWLKTQHPRYYRELQEKGLMQE